MADATPENPTVHADHAAHQWAEMNTSSWALASGLPCSRETRRPSGGALAARLPA